MIEIPEILETESLDLLILNRATPVLAFEVIAEGEIICFQDETVLNDFEMSVILKVQDTAYLRKVQNDYFQERVKEWYSKRNMFLNGKVSCEAVLDGLEMKFGVCFEEYRKERYPVGSGAGVRS